MDRELERLAREDRQNELTRLNAENAQLRLKLDRSAKCFRILRTAWFNQVLLHPAHERESETTEREKRREELNTKNRERFNRQTEELLSGTPWQVRPWCTADLDKTPEPESEGDDA